MTPKESDQYYGVCMRCGGDAQCFPLDVAETRIAFRCPSCGYYEVAKDEFDLAAAEDAGFAEHDR